MTRNIKTLILASSALALANLAASPALAGSTYLEPRIGVNIIRDIETDYTQTPPLGSLSVADKLQIGYAAELAAGYSYDNNFRIEASLRYQKNKYDKLKVIDDGGLGVSLGDPSYTGEFFKAEDSWVHTWSTLIKGFYDIDVTPRLSGYLGGGLGISAVKQHAEFLNFNDEDSDNVRFTWQGILGASWKLDPLLDLTAEYQFTTIDNIEIDHGLPDVRPYDLISHTIFVGIRRSF